MELRVPHVTSYARAPSSLLFLRSARYPQMPRFLREFLPMPLPLMIHSARALFAQRTRIPTSARSIGFCVIWVCISSSSSSIRHQEVLLWSESAVLGSSRRGLGVLTQAPKGRNLKASTGFDVFFLHRPRGAGIFRRLHRRLKKQTQQGADKQHILMKRS